MPRTWSMFKASHSSMEKRHVPRLTDLDCFQIPFAPARLDDATYARIDEYFGTI